LPALQEKKVMTIREKSHQFRGIFLGLVILLSGVPTVQAGLLFTHVGSADPTTEGFAASGLGPSTVEPVFNDFGRAAWSVAGSNTSAQFLYYSGALSNEQKTDISNQGLVLTLTARILQGTAPVYTPGNPYVYAAAVIDMGTRRYDIFLGTDSTGNTVVVLPTSYVNSGQNGSTLQTFGSSYTIIGSGYNTYQLVLNPQTQLAALYVDGIERLQNYSGSTYGLSNLGLEWGTNGGGQGNFNFVGLSIPSVPEPEEWSMLLLGFGMIGYQVKRKQGRKAQ
jgi:hypothetical protein